MSHLIRPVNDYSCSLGEDFPVFPRFCKLMLDLVSYGRGSWVVGTKSWVVGTKSWVPSRGSLLKISNDY